MSDLPGRTCPIRYRYGAQALASAPTRVAQTLYVVGGLYGNLQALDALEALAARETGPVTVCFNGDFNWFNVDDAGFEAINHRVLTHHAIAGNVEAELLADSDESGCGCAYPDHVEMSVVKRSNRIHARLKTTAARHPAIQAQLATLPLFARYQVGDCRVAVVHGDADSLAGWRFDIDVLSDPAQEPWLVEAFQRAQVDVFASTHTCQPVLRQLVKHSQAPVVINNGAAGMPNLHGSLAGIITRIGVQASPYTPLYGTRTAGVHIDALAVDYDYSLFEHAFLANWPPHSDAHTSYFKRIEGALNLKVTQVLRMF
jgi:diadenosine tetraphosphatase ApaH/serine/threonine PP2A family protein phosphatase